MNWNEVDEVFFGCANQAGEDNRNVAHMATLLAGYPHTVPGTTINRLCGSGLDAIGFAARAIKAGDADLLIAGGVESMSRVPMGTSGGAWAADPAVAIPTYFVPQGVSADMIASKWGFSRADVDAYSVESHKRAAQSWAEGRFRKSVVPVLDQLGLVRLDHDETIRPNTDMQTLGALNASFAMMGEMAFDSVINQRYPEARRVLDGITVRTARWYYLSSLANQGLGNSIDALQDARRAAQMEPGNTEYQMNLRNLQDPGRTYRTQTTYAQPGGLMRWCWSMILLNLLCNCCCGGGWGWRFRM
mgnify:CR=1 FL=1